MNARLLDTIRREVETTVACLQRVLIAVCVVAAACLILVALFATPRAGAQTPAPCPATPTCEPSSQPDRTLCGAELRGRTDKGEWSAFWWKDSARWCGYVWSGLYKFSPSPAQIMQIVDSIRQSPGPAAIMQAITQYSVAPAPGSQDEYDFKTLRHAACQALHASPPAAGLTIAGTCTAPAAPTPAPAPVALYVVTNGTLYPVTPAGARGAALASPKATLGQACDCTARRIANPYGGQYCAVTVPNVSSPVVAGCSLKK